MRTRTDIDNKLLEIKPVLMKEYFVRKIGYFGSYASSKQTKNSDVDIFVEFSKPIGWKFFTLEKYLEDTFGLKIDLVTKSALKEQLKDTILKNVRFV